MVKIGTVELSEGELLLTWVQLRLVESAVGQRVVDCGAGQDVVEHQLVDHEKGHP